MIAMEQVTVTYPDSVAPVIRDVNLRIPEGELCLVVGPTGSGKSTLLGAINAQVPHFTGGTLAGRVLVAGRDTANNRPRDLADVVGVVSQDPMSGFVTDTVEEELAYGMEQLGVPSSTMRKRVEETLDLLGLADLRDVALRELSGGQAQRVAIGSVLTAHPRILVLDEPTSALDPPAAEEVLAAITRLVHDLGITVVLAEHRLERVVQYADCVAYLGGDGTVRVGDPADILAVSSVAPPVVELARLAGWNPLPLSVRDARRRSAVLSSRLGTTQRPLRVPSEQPRLGPEPHPHSSLPTVSGAPLLRAEKLTVRYGELIAVRDLDLELSGGEIVALMGRNGSGKSSLLWALQGSARKGRVAVSGQDPARLTPAQARRLVGLVPQNPADLLYLETVRAELTQADEESGAASSPPASELLDLILPDVDRSRHPRDLSEGQRLALVLAIQLRASPHVVLLDEPTRGLDYGAKRTFASLLARLAAEGKAVVVATHDVEFVATCATRVVVMAEGEIVADGPTAEVVTASPVFAPQVAKILAPLTYLTVEEVREALEEGATPGAITDRAAISSVARFT